MARPPSIPDEDVEKALLKLFWQRGYSTTSLAAMSAVAGVGPSSLYSRFGGKEQMFTRAIDRYIHEHVGFVNEYAEDVRKMGPAAATRKLLRAAARLYSDPNLPGGCAMFNSAGSVRYQPNIGCRTVNERLSAISEQFARALSAGRKLKSADRQQAYYVLCVMQGLSRTANAGLIEKELLAIADLAAKVFE